MWSPVCRHDGHHPRGRRRGAGNVRRCRSYGWHLRGAPRSDRAFNPFLICYALVYADLPSNNPNLFTTLSSFAPRGRNARTCKVSPEGGPREQTCASTPRYSALKCVSAIVSVWHVSHVTLRKCEQMQMKVSLVLKIDFRPTSAYCKCCEEIV